MKYSLTIDNITTEFGDRGEAETYALAAGVSISTIVELEDEVIIPSPSSIEVFEAKVAAGYPIPNTPYFLAMGDSDRAQFTGMLVLIKELLDKGYIDGNTVQSIKTKDETIIPMTTDQFRSTMIGYGMYYKQIWDECDPL